MKDILLFRSNDPQTPPQKLRPGTMRSPNVPVRKKPELIAVEDARKEISTLNKTNKLPKHGNIVKKTTSWYECQTLDKLSGVKNVVNMYGYGYEEGNDKGEYLLFLEEGKPLADVVENLTEIDKVQSKLRFLLDIATGLRAIHKQKIAHGDIKEENVIIVNNIAKLIDFEHLENDRSDDLKFATLMNTESYPNVFFKLDVYRYLVLIHLLIGYSSFPRRDILKNIDKILCSGKNYPDIKHLFPKIREEYDEFAQQFPHEFMTDAVFKSISKELNRGISKGHCIVQ